MNFNDAKITSLYAGEPGSVKDIQDDAPNTQPGGKYRVTLEMVAGGGVAGPYKLITTCTDVTTATSAPAQAPGAPLNGAGTFQSSPWVPDGTNWVFNQSVTLSAPSAAGVYQLTAALYNNNHQIVSIRQSEPFFLEA